MPGIWLETGEGRSLNWRDQELSKRKNSKGKGLNTLELCWKRAGIEGTSYPQEARGNAGLGKEKGQHR